MPLNNSRRIAFTILILVALIALSCCPGGNKLPTAHVNSVEPRVAAEGEEVVFEGYGVDPDGTIVGWEWTSSLDGRIASVACFSHSSLSGGSHDISFKVRDNSGAWSEAVIVQIVIGATVAMNETIEIVIQEILPDIPEIQTDTPYACLRLDSSLPNGTLIEEDAVSGLRINLEEEIFFFYLDLAPQSDYPHSAKYILVDNEGNFDEFDVSWLPRIDGAIPDSLLKSPPDKENVIATNHYSFE